MCFSLRDGHNRAVPRLQMMGDSGAASSWKGATDTIARRMWVSANTVVPLTDVVLFAFEVARVITVACAM